MQIDHEGGIADPAGGWRCDAGIENVGDITYRQFGSGADGSGLSLVAGGQIRF